MPERAQGASHSRKNPPVQCIGGFFAGRLNFAQVKKPPGSRRAVLGKEPGPKLLQLHFLVFDVLACLGIKFHDQHLFGHRLLVLGRGVEVTGTRSGFQLDLVASAFACHGVSP
jgi:hypothetical protein